MTTEKQCRNALPSAMRGMRVAALPHEEKRMWFLLKEHNEVALNRAANQNPDFFGIAYDQALSMNRQERIELRERVRQNAPQGIPN